MQGLEADGVLSVPCEWFPAEPAEERPPDPWREGEEGWLETEVGLFGPTMRTAFKRLAEGLTRVARGKATTPPVCGDLASEQVAAVETLGNETGALRGELQQRLQARSGSTGRTWTTRPRAPMSRRFAACRTGCSCEKGRGCHYR